MQNIAIEAVKRQQARREKNNRKRANHRAAVRAGIVTKSIGKFVFAVDMSPRHPSLLGNIWGAPSISKLSRPAEYLRRSRRRDRNKS